MPVEQFEAFTITSCHGSQLSIDERGKTALAHNLEGIKKTRNMLRTHCLDSFLWTFGGEGVKPLILPQFNRALISLDGH